LIRILGADDLPSSRPFGRKQSRPNRQPLPVASRTGKCCQTTIGASDWSRGQFLWPSKMTSRLALWAWS